MQCIIGRLQATTTQRHCAFDRSEHDVATLPDFVILKSSLVEHGINLYLAIELIPRKINGRIRQQFIRLFGHYQFDKILFSTHHCGKLFKILLNLTTNFLVVKYLETEK